MTSTPDNATARPADQAVHVQLVLDRASRAARRVTTTDLLGRRSTGDGSQRSPR